MNAIRIKADFRGVTLEQSGIDTCLDCWRIWMNGDDRDLSASRMKLASDEQSHGYDRDVYAEQRVADMRIGEATGVMIDGLPQHLRWAIYRECGITTQWKFPALDYFVVSIEARTALEIKLRKNIATATLF